MNSSDTAGSAGRYGSLLMLALSALVAGAAAGLVGAAFRLSLVWADGLRDTFVKWGHNIGALGFLLTRMNVIFAHFFFIHRFKNASVSEFTFSACLI